MAGSEAGTTMTLEQVSADSVAPPQYDFSQFSQICEDDRCQHSSDQVWHCVDCDSNYCDDCWNYQGPHKAGKLGRDGVPHERTNVVVVARLKRILQPPTALEDIRRSHERDQFTKWFGVARDVTGRPSLEDYGRYATLMGSLQPLQSNKERYPQLVSFIGVTNAGKSTIIKMLVNHMPNGGTASQQFPTPVAGSVANENVATSGDVHLYADQSSHAGQFPILYGDCEGFEGGEKMPLGARIRKRPASDANLLRPELAQSRSLTITWANSEETRQREYAVRELYPRVLYTFSDVVVFVLRNPKTFQSAVLGKLLEWGASALEKSLNQPSLPHAIVLLNDTDAGVDEREWDSDYATQSLLSCVAGSLDFVEGVPRFRELAQYWRNLGKQINSVHDLILRYYSSFKVIRMPRKPRYTLMDRQVGQLHSAIREDCELSFKAKRKARMLTNSEELNVYLQSAFEHFTHTLTTPFNFVAVSLANNPISYNFGGHMLQLANTIATVHPHKRRDTGLSQWIFEKMGIIVASSLMLDCARYRKGRVEDLFNNYKTFFDWTLREYCDLWLPCAYTNGQGRYCMLVKARHSTKGHQDEEGIISHGEYQTSFTPEKFAPVWEHQLRTSIGAVQCEFQRDQESAAQGNDVESDERIALRLHRHNMQDFYNKIGGSDKIISHSSCFCCLMEVPEHPLPCGHVICSACVNAYGKPISKCVVTVPYCPLHKDATIWTQPHRIRFKHKAAGTRILCLDGGGIRGIVELEVLRAIEQALGSEIPVQAFFDLIVGSSSGGIIALALGVEQWSVEECVTRFASLCNRAYTPRAKGMPLLDLAATISHGSKYKTNSFHEALKQTFGEKTILFGGRNKPASENQTKVAVTCSSSTVAKTTILANYRRKEDTSAEHTLERPHEPDLEMRVWEAAAATSSTPTYFKPFVKASTSRTYLDGALLNGNPANVANRERKLIWPDTADTDPDLLLSLGTGQNRISILPKLSAKTADLHTQQLSEPSVGVEETKGIGRFLRSWYSLYNRIDDVLNAEMSWAAFRADLAAQETSQRNTRRYIRFNPDLNRNTPPLDAKSELQSLQCVVRKRLGLPHCVTAIQHVAFRLIASSFYFEVQKHSTLEDGSHSFSCQPLCKFEQGTSNLRALGRYLRRATRHDFRPYIIVKGNSQNDSGLIHDISPSVIERMITTAEFSMPIINVVVEDERKASNVKLVLCPLDGLEPEGFPISGFPKILATEISSTSSMSRINRSKHSISRSTSSALSPSISHRSAQSTNDAASITDSISLNGHRSKFKDLWIPSSGPLAGLKPQDRAADAPAVSSKALDFQVSYAATKKANRFWQYIGPQHMAHNRHLYSAEVLQKFVPSVAAEPVELDASDETEVKPMAFAELDAVEPQQQKDAHHELEGDNPPPPPSKSPPREKKGPAQPPPPIKIPRRERKDSARDIRESVAITETIMGDYIVKMPSIPGFEPPPAFPKKRRGFDAGELESAIHAAFG